jgi:DNA-binding response OmpR family regulator
MPSNDPFFHILWVDDDAAFQRLSKIALRRYGFDVAIASDGPNALAEYQANNGSYGAIIVNHELPRMTGLSFVRTLRNAGYRGRIIVISGRLTGAELQQYMSHKISGFFHKPFDMDMLAAMILRADCST